MDMNGKASSKSRGDMREVPKVALLVETSRGFGREFLLGMARYSRLHGPWSFHITPGDYKQVVPKMKQWGGTGIIARIADQRDRAGGHRRELADDRDRIDRRADAARQSTGEVFRNQLGSGRSVATGGRAPDRTAIDALRVRRQRRSRMVRAARKNISRISCVQRGFEPFIYSSPTRREIASGKESKHSGALDEPACPRRSACSPATTTAGARCWRRASWPDLNVPEDVAVVGVDNDEVFCELADPPLSSIALNAETAGYRAAALLDAMMQGRVKKKQKIVVEALGVVTRRSTDIVAVDDEDIADALQFIRRQHGRDISVDRVAEEVAMSRRSLEKRFRDTIGRTILEEIQLTRLERAKRLLMETTLSDLEGG